VSNLNIPNRASDAGPEAARANREPLDDGQEDNAAEVARLRLAATRQRVTSGYLDRTANARCADCDPSKQGATR
jgi:hypothetical protein